MHYSPKLVSIGPIHHDNTNLKTGEKYKLMWAAKYLENTGRNPRHLHKMINDNINELKGHFSDDVLTSTGKSLESFGSLEEKLSWMLFVDGCSLLHIMETPTHLLDLLHKLNLTTSKSKTRSNEAKEAAEVTYTGIEDLTAVGIRLKPTLTHRPTDIDYSEGWLTETLTLPRIRVDKTTATTFLNLIALEMCPDFKNNYGICSYVAFMDSLINRPEDVKVLRSNGILYTLAKLFNTMGTDLVTNNRKYLIVKTWIALGFRTYFNNPLAVIASVPAFIALVLTFIQTWFTVHPVSK